MNRFYPQRPGDPYFEVMIKYETLLGTSTLDAHVEVFTRGERLSRLGEPINTLYIIASGKGKICMIHEDGRQSILQFIGEGDYVGELSLLGVEDTPKNVVVLCECVTVALPLAEHRQALLSDTAFLRVLCEYLARKVLGRSERLTQNMNYPLRNRLAALILTLSHNDAYSENHAEAAEYLGVSYRHLLYSLSQFRAEGLLTKSGKGYRIENVRALEALAGDIRT